MNVLSEPFAGTYLVTPKVFSDHRGHFVKTFHAEAFAKLGFQFQLAEEFYSVSYKHVLRGMHLQLPPHDHAKIIYCIHGKVLDVLLDLRRSSSTYGQFTSAELSAENRYQYLIPKGVAHGFISLTDKSIILYNTSAVHSTIHDAGVRWDSFGFDWRLSAEPTISLRDVSLPALEDFRSPFR